MRILSNLPLECFDERSALRDVELVTYGPPDRMLVDGVHFRFDIAFDPSTGSWDELQALLPRGFAPDLVLLWWPDQEPIPAGLERCPATVVGVVSDYNLTLPFLTGLQPFFDLLLCDRNGQQLFPRLGFGAVRYWCQYAHKRPFHRLWPDAGPRDLDLGFAGNLDPIVQRGRAPWLQRVRDLTGRGVAAVVRDDVRGADYGRFLNRCRLGWNRSVRGEMNLRGFEVPACGALLLMERGNLEVREFFTPDEECVLYGDDDFEAIVAELLADPARIARIAAAGHHRVQQHRLGNRLTQLHELTAGLAGRRAAAGAAECELGRATAMLATWAGGPAATAAALRAHRLAPEDPRPLNVLGLATLRWRGSSGAEAAFGMWQRAAALDPGYVPALHNLAELLGAAGDLPRQRTIRERIAERLPAAGWSQLHGPLLPLRFCATTIERSLVLQAAVRNDRPQLLAECLQRG